MPVPALQTQPWTLPRNCLHLGILGQMPGSRISRSHTGLLLACERVHLSKGCSWAMVVSGVAGTNIFVISDANDFLGPSRSCPSVHPCLAECAPRPSSCGCLSNGWQPRQGDNFHPGFGWCSDAFLCPRLLEELWSLRAVLESCCSLRGDTGPTLAPPCPALRILRPGGFSGHRPSSPDKTIRVCAARRR